MEQNVKVGDYVILTDPLNYGKRAKVEEVNDDGSIVYDGGVTPLYLKEPKGIDAIAHPDYYNEKKYKEALEKLQEALAPKNGCEISGLTRGCIEEIFPELKETEDERIRDMLLRHIQRARGSLTNDEAGECIEWLKKQGNKNLHEFAMPICEVNNDYGMKQAEMLKDLMSQMDVKGQDDHRAKIAEREYWRKLRGDILLALLGKSTSIDLSLPDRASDLTERLYRQDKDFFRNLDKDKDFEE